MNLIGLTTPIVCLDDASPKFGALKHCLTFLSPYFNGRKFKVIETSTDGTLLFDKKPIVDADPDSFSNIICGVLKVIGWMTMILPFLAYLGAKIFHANNVFQPAVPKKPEVPTGLAITTPQTAPPPPPVHYLTIPGTDLVIPLNQPIFNPKIERHVPTPEPTLILPIALPNPLPSTPLIPSPVVPAPLIVLEPLTPVPSPIPHTVVSPAAPPPSAATGSPPVSSSPTIPSQPPSTSKRIYFQEVHASEKNDISYIVNTLGTASTLSLATKKGALEAAGDRTKQIHPLRFICTILTDPALKINMRKARERTSLVWPPFRDGLIASIEEEVKKNNMRLEFIVDIAHALNIEVGVLRSHFIGRNWSEFLDVCIRGN